ncbi:sel1 repeat family protein [Massilia forsythiae]|uniref:Sel1 repeat family protein n=1 Tax=Massilia forsythiae TaxID=2728020 RepID=A0A7Z2VZB7_9BURK|nr:tetratricopeptide repeat protein [Massilia forsythiae]QJE01938.1 sel1 repeat family protein [Massilia forsythiae]
MKNALRRPRRTLAPAPLALTIALAASLPAGAADRTGEPSFSAPSSLIDNRPLSIRDTVAPPAPHDRLMSATLTGRTSGGCPFLGPYNPALDPAAGGAATVPVSMTGCRTGGAPAVVDKGSAGAYAALAHAFDAYDRGDHAGALSGFRAAWSQVGYPEAALMLAQMHLYGQGVPADGRQAVYWLDRLAGGYFDPRQQRMRFDPAHPQLMSAQVQAAFMLARMYERGIGVEADPARAAGWYAKAAEFGFVPALAILADGWNSGEFGRRDEAKAHDYRARAAKAGYVTASRG